MPPSNFDRSTRAPYQRRDNNDGDRSTSLSDVDMDSSNVDDDSYRLVATIAYDGTNYEGFQTQVSGNTIQDMIEVRLSKLFDRRIHVAASGRTDAGVHARGQLIHFDVPKNADLLGKRAAGHLRKALQSDSCTSADIATLLESTLVADAWRVEGGSKSSELGRNGQLADHGNLPCDIQILSVSPAPSNNFHAREDCIGKRYVYTIQEGDGSPTTARYRWRLGRNKKLDVPSMNAAACRLIGEHDFSTFGLIEEGDNRTPRKRMRRLEVSRIESIEPLEVAAVGGVNTDASIPDCVVTIAAECDRYLYNQMRFIVGTLVEVGLGRLKPEDITFLLERKTRQGGKQTQGAQIRKAPAHGLCLHHCFYEPEETADSWMDSALEPESTEDDVQAALALLQL
jgi:tRNA pseudouridine38-40 synthase